MKKILVVAGLLILAAGGLYGWYVRTVNYGAFASEYPRYISDDGTIFVYGPDWSGEGGKCIYPIWVARKKFGLFWWFDKKLCKMVDSGSSGNVTLETPDKRFRFADCSRCYLASECEKIPICCELEENGEMVEYHLNCYGWTPEYYEQQDSVE